jgi:hypothetical protein
MLADASPRVGWLVQLGGTTTHRRAGRLRQPRDPADPAIAQRSGRRAKQQPALPLGQVRRDQREGRRQYLIQVHTRKLLQPLTPGKVTKRGPLSIEQDGAVPPAVGQDQAEDGEAVDPREVVRALLAGETPDRPVTGAQVQAATGLSRSRAYAVLRDLRAEPPGRNGRAPDLGHRDAPGDADVAAP